MWVVSTIWLIETQTVWRCFVTSSSSTVSSSTLICKSHLSTLFLFWRLRRRTSNVSKGNPNLFDSARKYGVTSSSRWDKLQTLAAIFWEMRRETFFVTVLLVHQNYFVFTRMECYCNAPLFIASEYFHLKFCLFASTWFFPVRLLEHKTCYAGLYDITFVTD